MTSSPRDRRFAYGLSIECDFALPDLPPDTRATPPDIFIERGQTLPRAEVEALLASNGALENVLLFDENRGRVLFSEIGRFTFSGGDHVLVEPLEGTSDSSWRLPLLGSILALLLEQRGLHSLHAGAVEMSGQGGVPVACAFAGDKGEGKSTLGAALSLAGFPLFCDDVLALQIPASRDKSPLALVGFGGIKLVPDAVRAVLKTSPDNLPRVAPELAEVEKLDKRHFSAPLASEARPLHHLFLLASHDQEENPEPDRKNIELRALSPQEALVMLLPHTFAARWGELYLKGARRASHFKACAHIATNCHVWELSRRRDLAFLPQTIELVVQTVAL